MRGTLGESDCERQRWAWAGELLLAVVGAVFVGKYGARVLGMQGAWAAAVGYAVAYVAGVGWGAPRLTGRGSAFVAAATVVAAVLLVAVTPDATQVARMTAIEEWWGALTRGEYPYGQPSRPSSFPGLFLMAGPFWAMGAVRLIPAVGLAGLFALARRVVRPQEQGTVVLTMAGLAPVWYEVVVRSELVANGVLVLGAVLVAEAARRRGHAGALAGAAVACGLALSTRLSAGLVMAVYGAWLLRHEPRWALAWGGGTLAVFALTLAPFWVWDAATFWALGPFSTQARFLPAWALAGGVAAALALGWTATSLRDGVGRAGGLLVGLALLALGLSVVDGGMAALTASRFDVAYLLLGVPFVAMALPRWRHPDGASP